MTLVFYSILVGFIHIWDKDIEETPHIKVI